MSTVSYPHVELTDEGVPIVSGTQTKVIEVALDRLAHHWDADEIHRQHPHLTLGQIHSALAYYYDHRDELDRAIQEGLDRVAEIQEKLGESPIAARIRRGA
ncbi:MAG: DUF433 domain-containing protein [Planctomycetes bacterium]|nr:DUF433 domain-containing protein [Planctomycetota bacterium]